MIKICEYTSWKIIDEESQDKKQFEWTDSLKSALESGIQEAFKSLIGILIKNLDFMSKNIRPFIDIWKIKVRWSPIFHLDFDFDENKDEDITPILIFYMDKKDIELKQIECTRKLLNEMDYELFRIKESKLLNCGFPWETNEGHQYSLLF